MSNVQTLPGAFPLHEDKDFLTESEWVIFKLLCRPVSSFADSDAAELSAATGNQVTPERCDELIRITRIHQLAGLGSWISRILAQAGLSERDMLELSANIITDRVNRKLGYRLCNDATSRALAALQQQWINSNTAQQH
ncbi:hypothetical protein [Mariprofundus ferrooxydans]|uniref:hypothetical protein n=1 Tax=Mariprofundus ferrooxydans TaxID=314344 RepID=UPI0014320FFA|nr:hypothetical protein [Mariprofundus ferrooxydans]